MFTCYCLDLGRGKESRLTSFPINLHLTWT